MIRRRAGVLGSPIAHTLSPVLHRAAYLALGLDWAYDVIECDERSLPAVVEACARAPEYAGLSLTMPLKARALELADHRAASAVQVGVANTLLIVDGETTAHNTDVGGLVLALAELGVVEPVAGAVVLGGGGTARAAIAALARIGQREVRVALRRPAAATGLVVLGDSLDIAVMATGWPASYRDLDGSGLVVSTAPAGATDALAGTGWRPDLPLLDVVYAPWPTGLGAVAAQRGASVVGGLAMLVGQAAEAVELMTGQPAPIPEMRAAGEAALAARTRHA